MKIAIDISQIVYEGTGVAHYTKELIRGLLAIDHENEYLLFGLSFRKLDVLESFFQSVKHSHANVSARFVKMPQSIATKLWNQAHLYKINRIIGNVDIFHASDWIQPPVHAKVVTTVHDLIVYKHPDTSHPKIISNQKRRLSWAKKECDAFFADSHATKKDMIDVLHIDPTKIHVVYLGVGDEYQPAAQTEVDQVKAKYRIEKPYILTVGTQEPRKNIHRLIDAFSKSTIEAELLLIGKSGWGRDVKNTRNVRSLGYIPTEELPALYTAATMFMYPSLYEGFGLPILEAMSCGCPVITTERGSLKEVAGDAALLCNPESREDITHKMTLLWNDKQKQHELHKKGRVRASLFTWDKTAKETLRIYKQLTVDH